MPGSGVGRKLGSGGRYRRSLVSRGNLLDQAATSRAVADDWFWGVAPPPVTVIPYSWLSPPAFFRADQPINSPQIQRTGAGTAVRPNATSISQYGEFPVSISLATLSSADAPALAYWFSTYYSGFRMRCPSLTINLLDSRRTQDEIWRVLGVRIGDRISIPDAPVTWPEGANTLMVEGIAHTVSQNERRVTFNTSPVIGATAGVVGPWFREGISVAGGTDAGPF